MIPGLTINRKSHTVYNLQVESALGDFDFFSCKMNNPSASTRAAFGQGGHLYPNHHVEITDRAGEIIFRGFLENVEDETDSVEVKLEGRDYRCLLIDERTGMADEWINQPGSTIINDLLLKYSTKVTIGSIDFDEIVEGTVHFNHSSLLNAVASVCNTAGKDYWIVLENGTTDTIVASGTLDYAYNGWSQTKTNFISGDMGVSAIDEYQGYYLTCYYNGEYYTGEIDTNSAPNHAMTLTCMDGSYEDGDYYAQDCQFWIHTSATFFDGDEVFKLNVGTRGSGSEETPAHTWSVGEELIMASEQKLARDIINRQRVFGAGDGINQIAVCVPYIDIGVEDDARHAGFNGYHADCEHALALESQNSLVGVMEGEPYYDASIIDTGLAIKTAKAILTASVGNGAKKLEASLKTYLSGVSLGDWVTVIDKYKGINNTARLKKIVRKPFSNKMTVEFLSGNESLEDILAKVKRQSTINNITGIGATNLICLNFPDICDTDHPYEFVFQLPEEIKFINRIKLSYEVSEFRGYSGVLAAGGAHSHSLGFWYYNEENGNCYAIGQQEVGGVDSFVVNPSGGSGQTSSEVTAHTHGIDFSIFEQEDNLTDVAIWCDDGSGYVDCTSAIETDLGNTLSVSQEVDIPLTNYFTADGGIKRIKIIPTDAADGECRITGMLMVQFYMESS